jgi:arginyl-tRNA synthetase
VADLQLTIASALRAAVASALGPSFANADPMVRATNNPAFGDYQANLAMGLAKSLNRNPREIAQQIVEKLASDPTFSKVEVAGPGFINLTLREPLLEKALHDMIPGDRLGIDPARPAQKIVVDYSSPNVAKEMHVGHLRSTIIGDAIARILSFLGHNVIRQNHLGDWGTQFGMLLQHLIDIGWNSQTQHTITDLDELYRSAKKRFDSDADFAERARKRVVALQSHEPQTLAIWHELRAESYRHFSDAYDRLNVLLQPSDVRGESAYNDDLPHVVNDLQSQGHLKQSDGAAVVYPQGFTDRDGNPLPMIVRKSDGGYLYATTDLAAARYRIKTLRAQRIIYVTDSRQAQHFAMLFQALRQVGWAGDDVRLDHVPFGTILGKDRRPFKTREGGTVKLSHVLDEAEQRALAVIESKNPDLPAEPRKHIAHVVGIGALKYADLSNDRIKDYVFDYDRMLALDGNTAPYLQNAYVRIRSIFRKGEAQGLISPITESAQPIHLADPAERALALKLLQLPQLIASVADSLEPHRLCTYLYELASSFHQFYESCPVLAAEDPALRKSRLTLCHLTASVLDKGLSLLGIGVVEQM